jgi:hypothetical protein
MTSMSKLIPILALAAAGTAFVSAVVIPWRRDWGRRPDDDRPLPGDDLVAEPTAIETRGIDIAAPVDGVWPWLVQMGYGRAGWYSYDALDMNLPSAHRIRPELAKIAVGDLMPTHPAGGFVVSVLDEPHALALYLDTDLVRAQAEAAKADGEAAGPINIQATGAFMEAAQPADFAASWAFVLEPASDGRTRLIERFRVRFGEDDRPWHRLTMPLMGFGVFVMMRKQMLGIRERAERTAGAAPIAPRAAALAGARP